MIHKLVFWKPGVTGTTGTDALYFYALLVAETPGRANNKVVSILPFGDDVPQPARLIAFVETNDDVTALNFARAELEALPRLQGYQVQASWLTK